MDSDLINLTLIDFIILQHLSQNGEKITRYKLMKQVVSVVGEGVISVPKFYRHVDRLVLNKYLKLDDTDEEKETRADGFVHITQQGRVFLKLFKKITGQIGSSVLNIFKDKMVEIIEFIQYSSGNVLLIDVPELLDLQFIEKIQEVSDHLHILLEDDKFKTIKATLGDIDQSKIVNDSIQEEDDYFSLIIVFFPTTGDGFTIYREINRVLSPSGKLVLLDNTKPTNISDHYVVEILVKQFWPFNLEDKYDMEDILSIIQKEFDRYTTEQFSYKGLDIRLLSA